MKHPSLQRLGIPPVAVIFPMKINGVHCKNYYEGARRARILRQLPTGPLIELRVCVSATNKARYTATLVACGCAGAVLEKVFTV